ncbi:hypothetical protein [Streptomyces niveus]|uniref:hypothetical protein n=1 Tax=Streptomyces niveus TaxID=193462 RepID=UPI003430CFFC
MSDEVLNLPVTQAAVLMRQLMEVLYLSTACASGNHRQCRQVDKFRSLVCCCPECQHSDLRAVGPTSASTPLLHLARTPPERLESHIYSHGELLGVRSDLVLALEKTLQESAPRVREKDRQQVSVQLGIAACLTFAPRSL